MSAQEPISENELNAYVDGELSGDERRVVEARLSAEPEAAERAGEYKRIDDLIRARYGAVAHEPTPAEMKTLLARHPPATRSVWFRFAAAILLLLIGGAGGFVLRGYVGEGGPRQIVFVDEALGAHVVFAAEVRHPVEVTAKEEEHLVKWLTKRVGAELRAPALGALNFQLVGGRLLASGAAPAAQFMYEDGKGRRVTLYVRQSRELENTSFQFASHGDVSAFYWIDRPLAYAIIAELPRQELLTVARVVYEQLE